MKESKVRKSVSVALSFCFAGAGVAAPPSSAIDPAIFRDQVILDRLGFSPGVIDGQKGQSLVRALKGLQQARGFPQSGEVDEKTKAELGRYQIEPVKALKLAPEDLAGPFVGPIPADPSKQAALPSLGYSDAWEALAERFHTTPATLQALNPGAQLVVGAEIKFPNVLPPSRDYPSKLKPEWVKTLSQLNVDPAAPEADHVVVDKSDGVLRVFDAKDKLIAQFSATMGSSHDPLPIGKWKIQGASYNPKFHFNPKLFWDAKPGETKEQLPAGPNGPVGVVWLDLDKPHYGIHGTPSPEKIGRTESHGCIRLTNWDAARLSLMVKPGTPAIFEP
jgi:lipoprotein-anchoring transpeptidase ErfK/SrfK